MTDNEPISGATIIRRDPPELKVDQAVVDQLKRNGAPADLVAFAQRHADRQVRADAQGLNPSLARRLAAFLRRD